MRIVLRLLVCVVVASLYVVIVTPVIDFTKPVFEPRPLTEAIDAAARDAAKRGDTSVCGIEIPRAVREAIAAGNASLVLVTTGDKRPVAACLHKRGYLTTAGVEAVEDFERDREWQWWEDALWALGFIIVVGGCGYVLLGRRRRGPPPTANPEET